MEDEHWHLADLVSWTRDIWKETYLLQMSMQKNQTCCPQKGSGQRLWLDLFLLLCSVWLPECGHLGPTTGISIAYFKELCGMLPPFAALPLQSSGSRLVPSSSRHSCQAALTVRTCLLLSVMGLFTTSRKGRETFTWHNTLDFQLAILHAKGERLLFLLWLNQGPCAASNGWSMGIFTSLHPEIS